MMGLVLKYLAKCAPALATAIALMLGSGAVPANAAVPQQLPAAVSVAAKAKKPTQAELNREVASAKEAVAKNCNGLNVEPGQWVDKGSKRYGRQYVCLRHFSDRGADKTMLIMILVPTNRVAGSSHKAVIELKLDGYPTQKFKKTVTNQAYVKTIIVEYGQSGKVRGIKYLDGADAKSNWASVSPLS